jgi:hypothetical protein
MGRKDQVLRVHVSDQVRDPAVAVGLSR